MRRTAWVFSTAGLTLALFANAQAQVPPEEQARRLLEDGRSARSQGKIKQALDSFGIIVTGFANTAAIDDALLEIGRTHLEQGGDSEKARQAFDQVATRYPQGDAAPGAYYYLGWIALERATTAGELDDALAQFARLRRVYASSVWIPRALHATGLAHRKARRFREAVDAQRRVFLEYPSDEVAPRALFECAHALALLGRPREAMEEYQRLRNRFPKEDLAARALDRLTALHRLYGGAQPVFNEDAAFALPPSPAFKEVTALLAGPDETLWVASPAQRSVALFAAGRPATSLAVPDPVDLLPTAQGSPLVVTRGGVQDSRDPVRPLLVPTDKPGIERPLERIGSALPTRAGGLLAADLKLAGVYRFDAQGKHLGRFGDSAPSEITRMRRDGEGDIVFLDERARSLRFYDEQGRPLRSIGPQGQGYVLRRPSDVAIDDARNIYVADQEEGLLLLDPDGKLLLRIGATVVRKPAALALSSDGMLYVYDEKLKRVLRFR